MTQTLISLNRIRCKLNRHEQFFPLNWRLNKHEHWLFYGENGAGKTALAKIISAQLPISSGERLIDNTLAESGAIQWISHDTQQALVNHDNRFDDSETRDDVFDNGTTVKAVIFGSQPITTSHRKWLSALEMENLLNQGIRYISSGQMRKTLLLTAFVTKPKLLILDDPLAGLDSASQIIAETLIETLIKTLDNTLLLLSRNHRLAKHFNHLAIVKNCELKYSGAMDHSLIYQKRSTTAESIPKPRAHSGKATLISLDNVVGQYRDNIVFKLNHFSVIEGQHIAISGPNGCGKSTLLQLITGENTMAYGQNVYLFGKKRGEGESVWDIKQHFGIVSNALHANFGREWRVIDIVISGIYDSLGLNQKAGDVDTHKAKSYLKTLNLHHLEEKPFKRLSFGQQRTVLLARALIKQPQILLLDEACTGLDDKNYQHFLEVLTTAITQQNTTVISVSHLAEEQPAFITTHWEFTPNKASKYELAKVRS